MYIVGLSVAVCTLSIQQLPEWLLDQTHACYSWVQWPPNLPIMHQSGSCGALVSLGCAMAFRAAVSGWTVTEALHIPASLATLSSLHLELVHEILSELCSFSQGLSEQKLPHWKPRECCRSSGPAVTLCLATGAHVLKRILQFQVYMVCHLVRDSAHFKMSFGMGNGEKTLIPTCNFFFFNSKNQDLP